MKQNIGKRLASLVLALVLVVGMMPMTAVPAHAATKSPCSGNHSDWTAISDNIDITQAGKYYLSSDYTDKSYRHNIDIDCEGEVTLCLNGKALTNTQTLRYVIYLRKGSLNLCDCVGTGYIDSSHTGVYALSNTQFNMYGGTIKECYVYNDYGSAVLLENATFNMYGGSITGNNAGRSKCGAVGAYGATINIYGGSITGNNTYGVYSEGGSVHISGNAKITGNALGDVYLGDGQTITVGTLTTGADIGVTSASGENDIAITGTNAADYSQYFHADNSDYQILNKDNVIYLHKHSSTYSIGDKPDVLVERCNICSHSAEATLIAENKTYTGSAITDAATVDYSDNWAGSKDAAVIYTPKEGSTLTDGKAVNVGKYTASVQVGSATASADFEITPKSIAGAGITFNPESAAYPDSTEAPAVIVKDGEKVLTEGSDYDLDWNEGAQWVTPATNTVTVTGKGNYKDSVDQSFTINPGTLPGTISAENVEKEYDGTGYSITVTGVPDGATVTYSTDGLTYTANNPAIVNVNDSATVHYKVSKEHYEDFEGSAAVTIKPKAVTVSGITAEDREYDGTAGAVLRYDDVTFAGKLDGDALSLTAIGTFDSKDAGENKTVTITGLTLAGASAGNYTLAADGQQTTATATISPKAVTVKVKAEDKTYDGYVTATVSATVDTGISGETITITGLIGSFITPDAGENKIVTVDRTNEAVTYNNATEGNYALTFPTTTTANIGAASMVVTAEDYTGTYDGTSHGITVNAPEGAKVEYSTDGTVWSETNLQFTNVADSTTVSYRVTKDNYETVTGSKTVTINPIEVTVTVDAIPDQTYTGSAIAPTVTVTPEENKLVEGDTLVKGTDYTVSCSTNTNVGTATVTISDVEGGNYTVSGSGTFQIVPAANSWTTAPSVSGWTYGETANAAGKAKFGAVTVTYAEKGKDTFTSEVPTQAGDYTAKFIVADTANYNGLTATVDFTIAKKPLTVIEAAATGREYDGTKTVAITAVTLDGIVGEDTVAVDLTDLTGTLESANKGTYTSVTLPELKLKDDKGNYTLTQPTAAVKTNVEITAKPITVTVADIADQTWTGSALTPAVVSPTGLVKETDEYCTVTYTDNTNVGLATVKVEEKGNYTFTAIEKTFLIVPDELLIANLTTENVTSANKANVDKAVEMMNNADLNDAPAEDKAAWEALKTLANDLQDQLEAADAADETQNIQDVEGINAGNVKLDQKQDLKDALKDLESAKENYYGNYTAEEKAALDADIKRVEDALAAIERVEDFNTAIDDPLLKKDVKTDMDAATEEAIKDAQDAYNALSDYEKTLVDPADKTRLGKLVATITDYKITKGDDGRYVVGSGKTLSFTANGPVRKFDYVQVNRKTVASSNYTVTEGSTIITLKSRYLDKLGYGKHKIQIFYTDGSTEVADFRIYVTGGNPFTGDSDHIVMFGGIMMTSLLCLVMMAMFATKKKGKNRR